jgi:hypothetical protein
VAVLGNLEAMRLRKGGQLFVPRISNDLTALFVPDIADAFKKEQRENISFEVSGINWPAKNIGGFPEVAFELAE